MKTKQFTKKAIGAVMIAAAMLLGTSYAFAQVKIGRNPSIIGAGSNLEVESASGQKVIVDKTSGTLKVENKPLAPITDSIVTRGLDGELHQISRMRLVQEQKIPVTVFSGNLVTPHTAPPWTAPHNQLSHRVNLTPRPGYAAGWNGTTKQFTLPEDGFYRVEVGLSCLGTGITEGTVQYTRVWSSADEATGTGGNGQVVGTYQIVQTGADTQSIVWSGQWLAGSTVSLLGMSYPSPGTTFPTWSGYCQKGYMTITKVP